MKRTFFLSVLILPMLLTGCAAAPTVPTITPTLTATQGPPTATINWFPATNTATPFATGTSLPTPEQHPGQGELLISDTFDQSAPWNTSVSSNASAVVTLNRLVLSLTGKGPSWLVSLRNQPSVGDFYAEADVSLSLCSGKDQFGMVFRASPGSNDYRFQVSCDGEVRLTRVSSGSIMPLLDWIPTGDAPNGAPADLKLGVWAAGNEMRFFLNDTFQFSFRDPIFHSGTIGFFIYINGADPITAAFSNLQVYSVDYVAPTASPIPSQTPKK